MNAILPLQRPMRRNTIAQDASGTIFSRGALLGYPPLSTTRIVEGVFRASPLLQHFARWKTVWTLPSLWTQRTRPQGTWKLHQPQFSTAPTPITFFLQEEQEQQRTLQVCQSDCLNRGVHPSALCR
jgi:hypothetical protein